MKEFRDAKKAMEMAIKQKDLNAEHSSNEPGGRGRKRAKQGSEKPLFKAAITNHA